MHKRYTITQLILKFPSFVKRTMEGKYSIISYKGKDICSVIPAHSLKRLESIELEDWEDIETSQELKSVIQSIRLSE